MERLVLSLPLEGLQRYDCQACWAFMRGEIYMREWEKMLAGELYDPADHELKAGREAARTSNCHQMPRSSGNSYGGNCLVRPRAPPPFTCHFIAIMAETFIWVNVSTPMQAAPSWMLQPSP